MKTDDLVDYVNNLIREVKFELGRSDQEYVDVLFFKEDLKPLEQILEELHRLRELEK